MVKKMWATRQSAVKTSSGSFWRPEPGENLVRLYPFRHIVTAGDFALGRYGQRDTKEGEEVEELYCLVREHFKPSPGICGKIRRADRAIVGDCENCDKAAALMNEKGGDTREVVRQWSARDRLYVNIVSLADPTGFKIWAMPASGIEYVRSMAGSDAYKDTAIFGREGMNLLVVFNKAAKSPQDYYRWSLVPGKKLPDFGPAEDLFLRQDFVPLAFRPYLMDVKRPAAVVEEEIPDEVEEVEEAPPPVTKKTTKKATRKAASPSYAKGDTVSFDDDGEERVGTLIEKDGGEWVVQVEDDLYRCTEAELTKVG